MVMNASAVGNVIFQESLMLQIGATFKVFVVPGGSFVKKIFKEYRPEACLGVACYNELAENMQAVSFIPVHGILLLRDGCFNTQANVEEIIQKMEMCNV